MRLRTSSGFATFVCCYAPTLTSDSDLKDRFYSELDDTIKNIKPSDVLYLLGDFNARVGAEKCLWPEVLGSHGTGKMNENGQRLLEFCSYHHLCITNTFFENNQFTKVFGDILDQRLGIKMILPSQNSAVLSTAPLNHGESAIPILMI